MPARRSRKGYLPAPPRESHVPPGAQALGPAGCDKVMIASQRQRRLSLLLVVVCLVTAVVGGAAAAPGNGISTSPIGTCASRCGQIASDESCYCDVSCAVHGDCCSDYSALCAETGLDHPGEAALHRAEIHAVAVAPDASTERETMTHPLHSCVNRCGLAADNGACFCDLECARFGDCCSDFTIACDEEMLPGMRDMPRLGEMRLVRRSTEDSPGVLQPSTSDLGLSATLGLVLAVGGTGLLAVLAVAFIVVHFRATHALDDELPRVHPQATATRSLPGNSSEIEGRSSRIGSVSVTATATPAASRPFAAPNRSRSQSPGLRSDTQSNSDSEAVVFDLEWDAQGIAL
eukprot:m.25271 g.25271  ORF g.25271 m.25271 type:complete len:347 (-) comp4408_c0_seq2:3090-4130(-)